MDEMVLATQKWLNKTYEGQKDYSKVKEDGQTGWNTINALLVAMQIELGMPDRAPVFGPTTERYFKNAYPNGIMEQSKNAEQTSNMYNIIQGAMWCKGYNPYANFNGHFYAGMGSGIQDLKNDMGIGGDSTVTIEVMKALLSMQQFVLLTYYGGKESIRSLQQQINRKYRNYTGIIPCDGLYGREMNTALIQILQAIEGYSPSQATGYFGNGTKGSLVTITASNASSYKDFVWIASAALMCNGYNVVPTKIFNEISDDITEFQKDYALPQTGILDVNTWMSLFISKGNPDRRAKACDTRFEITDALLSKLKKDGYEIVGRYLTGGSFKEIRDGELERIVKGGMKYFPIFQENGRAIEEFTYETGREHGLKASSAALKKGVPSTVIYFAVDMDIYDYQIDSNIIPYFRGINETIDLRYEVGIYASRNVCTRVSKAGYAKSSFVSDMSTGFSGNLGFTIPNNWNYDQFHEISGYGGNWDLDKVAYSGRKPACSKVNNSSTDYFPYSVPTTFYSNEINAMEKIQNIIPLIEELEKVHEKYVAEKLAVNPKSNVIRDSELGVLVYLAKGYLKDRSMLQKIGFEVVSSSGYDDGFDSFLSNKYGGLKSQIDSHISIPQNDISLFDGKKGFIDLGHLAITTLSYYKLTLNPASWNGWAGDLVSAYRVVENYYNENKDNINVIARAYIGGEKPMVDYSKAVDNTNHCNYTDLCTDGYAILLSNNLKKHNGNLTEAFKRTFIVDLGKQFEALLNDIGAKKDIYDISRKVSMVVKMPVANLLSILENGRQDSSDFTKDACIQAFSKWLYSYLG